MSENITCSELHLILANWLLQEPYGEFTSDRDATFAWGRAIAKTISLGAVRVA